MPFKIELPEWRVCDNCNAKKYTVDEKTGRFYCGRKKSNLNLGEPTWCSEFYPKRDYCEREHDWLFKSLSEARLVIFNVENGYTR